MISFKRNRRLKFFIATGITCILISQAIWIHGIYRLTEQLLIVEAREAFAPAYQKEQAYRVPFTNILNSGAVTIESYGAEEIQIIRYYPEPDTIIYHNPSDFSIESFINHVFVDLREQISPINIFCLSDLYSGMLFEKDIHLNFVIERFNTSTGEVIETSLLPDKKQPKANPETTFVLDISDRESLRAVLQITSAVIFRRMTGAIVYSILLAFIIIACLFVLYAKLIDHSPSSKTDSSTSLYEDNTSHSFVIGQYKFIPAKNELQGYGKTVQLNKKENSILCKLCMQYGNVVERNMLLEENWGKNGNIYSRSLDTYITALRKYLKEDPSVQIVAIKGVGYKLVESS